MTTSDLDPDALELAAIVVACRQLPCRPQVSGGSGHLRCIQDNPRCTCKGDARAAIETYMHDCRAVQPTTEGDRPNWMDLLLNRMAQQMRDYSGSGYVTITTDAARLLCAYLTAREPGVTGKGEGE